MSERAVTQYLTQYAEVECMLLHSAPAFHYQASVVIPAYKESTTFLQRFLQQYGEQSVLLIAVVNQPDTDDNITPQSDLCEFIASSFELRWQHENIALYHQFSGNIGILLVDRFSTERRIPAKQGVGLARKIGADIASYLIAQKQIDCPWVGSTDADAILPQDYFAQLNSKHLAGAKAATFAFSHIVNGDPSIFSATRLYEQWLHYYKKGLAWAGSPYAFYTIGSCLAFDYQGYCQVRGFPKRAGGEDFYLLNKMAKLAPVVELDACIHLQSRVSDRVPFGTGPAVQKIIEQQSDETQYLVYNPQVFVQLKSLLQLFNTLFESCSNESLPDWMNALSQASRNALMQSSFEQAVLKIKGNCKNQHQFLQQVHGWFDGFRTLKYIHALENDFSPVCLQQAREIAPFEF
ncbi:hypothetical protein KIH87_02480 [Paraneptunicella aestuarii]|uniref:hypothetical protein n=1 Tax=Paraneptunicella aestuarii TaxID=2831148 RepID=UPI001E450208|nr:hypothetical protein [Paraneptunicella aestuarii]UAA39250.1 hypothetical protein KIH87_02480 [Paraneptunicella aestuarii]